MRLRVLQDRNLRVLFLGQALNMLGNTAMIIVLGIWVKDLTGSNGAAGLIFLLTAVSSFLGPLAGLIADRYPRRWVLVVNDTITGILMAALVLVHNRGQVWLIYVVAVLYGLSGQIYRSARGGLVHSMVPKDMLGDTNGLFSSLGQGLRIVAPVAGAALYTAVGGGAVAIANSATFAVSVISYLMLRNPPDLSRVTPDTARPRGEFLREVAAGARHVAGNPVIRRMVLASAVAFTGAGMIDVAMFALVDQGLHRSTALIGVLGGIQGIGSVAAGFVVGPAMRRFGEYAIACVGFLLNGVGLALASTANFGCVIAGGIAIGLGLPMVLVAEITLVQHRTPGEMQGRAIAASDAIINIPFALAIAVGAIIINAVGFRPIYLVTAAGFTAVGLWLLPYLRVTKPEPAAETSAEPAPVAPEAATDATPA